MSKKVGREAKIPSNFYPARRDKTVSSSSLATKKRFGAIAMALLLYVCTHIPFAFSGKLPLNCAATVV